MGRNAQRRRTHRRGRHRHGFDQLEHRLRQGRRQRHPTLVVEDRPDPVDVEPLPQEVPHA